MLAQSGYLLLNEDALRVLLGRKRAHGLELDFLGRNLRAQVPDGFDDGLGLAVELDHAGLLLGFFERDFGVAEVVLGLLHLLLEEEAAL